MIRPRHEGRRNGQRWKEEGVINDRKGILYSRSKESAMKARKGVSNEQREAKKQRERRSKGQRLAGGF